jgi:hypothetical protein
VTALQDEVAVAYEGLGYDQAELAGVMRRTYDEILAFITTPEFTELLAEMGTLGAARRPAFIAEVLLDPEELQQRGVVAPEGILIQRSAFGDRRPTLFVVKKFLPDKYRNVWQNVNITFDNEYEDHEVTRDAQLCWRPPLDPDDQARAMAEGRDLAAL